MHKIRQILLFLERGVSQRSIEKEVKISRKTIAIYLLKQSDQELEQLLGLAKPALQEPSDPRTQHFNSLISYFNKELSRIGVTRLLLWEEYIREYPEGFQYSRFCELLQDQMKLNQAVMHFVHHPA
jgi:transposase